MFEKEGFGGSFAASNNQMELSAALYGLRAPRKSCKVIVHSDSEYVVNAFNRGWIDAWRNRNWTKLKNLDLWLALIEEAGCHETTFKWVPSQPRPRSSSPSTTGRPRRRAARLAVLPTSAGTPAGRLRPIVALDTARRRVTARRRPSGRRRTATIRRW